MNRSRTVVAARLTINLSHDCFCSTIIKPPFLADLCTFAQPLRPAIILHHDYRNPYYRVTYVVAVPSRHLQQLLLPKSQGSGPNLRYCRTVYDQMRCSQQPVSLATPTILRLSPAAPFNWVFSFCCCLAVKRQKHLRLANAPTLSLHRPQAASRAPTPPPPRGKPSSQST